MTSLHILMELKIFFVAQLHLIEFIWHSSLLFRREYTIGFYGAKLFCNTTSASSALARSEGSGQIVRSPLQATAMPQKRLPLAMVVTALLLLLVPTVRLMGAEPMILSPELKRLSLGGHKDILEDQARQWTIREIVAKKV